MLNNRPLYYLVIRLVSDFVFFLGGGIMQVIVIFFVNGVFSIEQTYTIL